MSKKEQFIKLVELLLEGVKVDPEYDGALEYFEAFKQQKTVEKPKFTENGKKILKYMQDNKEVNGNIFNAKGIGEGLFISSRGASGALRKLVTDGYVEKIGESPVCYSLTQIGIEEQIEEEDA